MPYSINLGLKVCILLDTLFVVLSKSMLQVKFIFRLFFFNLVYFFKPSLFL